MPSLLTTVAAESFAACEPHRAFIDRKGTVEDATGHTQATALKSRRFESIEEQNDFLLHWEAKWVASRIPSRERRQVQAMFEEEKPHLQPLPLVGIQYFTEVERTVYDDSCVRVGHSPYVARPASIGAKVVVRVFEPFLDTFGVMLQDELDRLRSRLMERRFQHSHLDERPTLNDFDSRSNPKLPRQACFQLHTLKFIGEGCNTMIIGKPGTGKSHIAKAVAYQATLQGVDVRYVEADTEFTRYGLGGTAEQAALRRGFVQPDLVVLDDAFRARRISEASAELLQTVAHQRYKQRRSIVLTSNRVVQDWGKYLGDATMATTILDRLMHRAAMLEFEGKSYRLKEASSRLALNTTHNPQLAYPAGVTTGCGT